MAQKSRSSYDPEFNSYRKEKYQSETLTLIRLQGVFILWFGGLFISILIFIIEKYILRLYVNFFLVIIIFSIDDKSILFI
jgi:hypothetical protein